MLLVTLWLAQILKVLSLRMRMRQQPSSLRRIFTSPVPRSFHSAGSPDVSYRYSLPRNLSSTSSSSSSVFTSHSGSFTTGSKWMSGLWARSSSWSPTLSFRLRSLLLSPLSSAMVLDD
uniref:Putative secreted protein n=1 Tax=Ixodes ricinus TaxID=34613 RepID=A0A6B0UM00_IXORI